MITRTSFAARALVAAAFVLGCATALHAQYEISNPIFNRIFVGPLPNDADNTPPILSTQPQFAGEYANSGGSAPVANSATLSARYPSQIYHAPGTGVPTGAAIVMQKSAFGGAFAAGVPRYLLGDTMLPPATEDGGVIAAAATYWRQQPVVSGENFIHPAGGNSTPVPAGVVPNFYFSPHAERVFATQAGRVAITWVTRVPVTTASDATLKYRFREESFAVSSATNKPTRTIYWTEKSFNGPVVNIPTGAIETVNPVYSTNFPANVATEYSPIGVSNPTDPSATAPAEKRTLWFQKVAGIGQLHAYNVEGRIFVEYLGALKDGASAVHNFLGADIVEVVRVAPTINAAVNLGEQITPRDTANRLLPLDGSTEWLASPVQTPNLDGQSFFGTNTRPDGRLVYFAERENANPDRVVFYWLEKADAAIHFVSAPGAPNLGLYWPQQKNAYVQTWPTGLSSFAHYTVSAGGSTAATGLQFAAGLLPQIVYQDDPAQSEATIDTGSQRLRVSATSDGLNRSLLKFTSANQVWYVRLYTQAEGRVGFQEGDESSVISMGASVGDRINAPNGYEIGGYIASGTNYLPSAYFDPFAVGATAAAQGAIIPVNAMPGANVLKVWWFKKIEPLSPAFQPFYVPAKIGTYTVTYPGSPATIVLASNAGSGDLSGAEIAGSLYVQNNRALPGFNPNEEHALTIGGRAYALRDDLNDSSANPATYTSEPFVLLRYLSPVDARPAMRAFKVLREIDLPGTVDDRFFDYAVTAGTILQAPMPLPLLPLPLDAAGRVKNLEVPGTPDSAIHATAPSAYDKFTFKDRKGYDWVYRGPHAGASPTLGMQFYYTMREGFHVPGVPAQPAVGTVLPYLRPLVSGAPTGDPVTGTSLTIIYRPVWPANAPELRVAETLTLPKFGLPAVLPQVSAQVFYQQSFANEGTTKPSVILHDPIREKTFALGATGGLASIPTSIRTSTYQGKTYFQGLPPHLQARCFYDPLRGPKGSLVLLGTFVDEVAGEDFLHLNVLSADDKAALEGLPVASDTNRAAWISAVGGLATKLDTFIEDQAKTGTYKSNGFPVTIGAQTIASITNPDTAVVDYALTATGSGAGWVTMVFGNGKAFTPMGDPVAVQVFRVAPRLNTGELKVQLSANPLDEQVSLRHSGDFAAKPEDYEFEWRYAPPQDGVAPGIYSFAMTSRLALAWQLVQSPAAALPTAAEYAAGLSTALPRTVQINPPGFSGGTTRPGLVARSSTGVDFTSGVPAKIIFSANVADLAGLVLYVNGAVALANHAPAGFTNATAGTELVSGGLTRQFEVNGNSFQQGVNTLEVALYSTGDAGATSALDFRLHASVETDLVAGAGSPWQTPNGTLGHQVIVGGSPAAPLGSPLLVLSDNYFTMRYRPKASANNVAGTAYSRWMPPKLVEGWIKRVLAAINPFNQRMRDLYNNAVNTDVSILTQAGKRWEGNVALTLENINDFGLIEIYETVLNRGKNISIDSGYDYAAANDALLLAAGYLADLYTIAGNEAYADAANPTISIDDSTTVTEVNTSRFSFESQVSSVLQEELALLRGRDDFLAPGITVAPAYNRMYWNYTRGINSGEALYAVNYNIREKAGSPTADGILDAADAQRMFPQGHGDAYGHYLTALKGYYRLLQSPNFTWTPRSEAVTVLGQAIQIDYFDERKFAGAAASLARTAQQVLALTHRETYQDDPGAGWTHLRDGKINSATATVRHWGLEDWGSRATQGAYFNWIVGNAILPDKDIDPNHTGVQVIDRTTVPELAELPTLATDFQTRIDNANAHLNPLGLSPGAIAFDISPTDLKAGKSHYDQVHERSLRAVLNAKGAFDQAARMTRLLRNQENQIDHYNAAIVDQERGFVKQLIEIYGTPYTGEIGAGKVYAQGYAGPDTLQWFIVDRPSDMVNTTAPITVSARLPVGVNAFSGFKAADITAAFASVTAATPTVGMVTKSIAIQSNRYVQFADVMLGSTSGVRSVTGTLQQALVDSNQAHLALQEANAKLQQKYAIFHRRQALYAEMVATHLAVMAREKKDSAEIRRLGQVQGGLQATADVMAGAGEGVRNLANSLQEFFPRVVGLANDATSSLRGAIVSSATYISAALLATRLGFTVGARVVQSQAEDLKISMTEAVTELGFSYEQAQSIYEYELLLRDFSTGFYEIAQLATNLQRANERVRNLVAEGDRLQAERLIFRQRAAALIQGYRTKDLTFRTFRNEALEQYRSLFDLAGRYTYLAAKSYDYETGLLGTTAGQAVINGVVASRSLGDLTGGVPQATVSTLGDSGLAGTMARMQADWSVAKPRLGINNPDQNGTVFSLRRELFRITDAASHDAAWQQTIEQHVMSNILADADVATHARNLRKADGSAVPGIVIPFQTIIAHGVNFFGLPVAGGDHAFSATNFATKIYSVGIALRGYVGMDPYAVGTLTAASPHSSSPNSLSATPYIYLIPAGTDYMLAPPLGDTGVIRGWNVKDQALPLPFNLGASAFSATHFVNANGTLGEQPWILRKHQAFRPVHDPAFFYSSIPSEFTSSRLVGRSVWNGGWKIVIPAYTLLANEQDGLNRFAATVKDIELFLRTYSNAGN